MPEIGATLREARMRARIDVSDIEAQTKIRAKYLRALENEEWDLLPGSTYVRSFLRTYAQALGLDPRPLLEEYRSSHDRPNEVELAPISGSGRRQRGLGGPPVRGGGSRGFALAVGAVLVVIVLLVIGLVGGGGSSKRRASSAATHRAPGRGASAVATAPRPARPRRIALQLRPTAPVYVCLIGDRGRKLIDKVILQPGSPEPVYRAHRFQITLGNSAVTMRVNGRTLTVPPSNNATGYVITSKGRRTLAVGQLPTCA